MDAKKTLVGQVFERQSVYIQWNPIQLNIDKRGFA